MVGMCFLQKCAVFNSGLCSQKRLLNAVLAGLQLVLPVYSRHPLSRRGVIVRELKILN